MRSTGVARRIVATLPAALVLAAAFLAGGYYESIYSLLAALVWLATRRPRRRILDAFLVGIAVSLVFNDTPQDVLLWGSLQAFALRRAV
jgi:RsiW-degrading membrane proteinase PrsW (M82 family)